jgi:hypothetical protein
VQKFKGVELEKCVLVATSVAFLMLALIKPIIAWADCPLETSFVDRMVMLHEKLKLTDRQEYAWNTFVAHLEPESLRQQAVPQAEAASAGAGCPVFTKEDHPVEQTLPSQAIRQFYAVLTPEQQVVFDSDFDAPVSPPAYSSTDSRFSTSEKPNE